MTRNEYRTLRKSIRENGVYALRWMDAHQAAVMLRLTRAPGDRLAQRVDVARVERTYGAPVGKASRFAFLVTTAAKRHTV